MFCTNCGATLPDNVRFCGKCGAPQVAPVQEAPVQAAPVTEAAAKRSLYMDAKGLAMFNFKFDIKDAAGNVCYRAATVMESLVAASARIYNPDDSEAMIIRQQKKMTLGTMNFDILDPNGELVTEVIQKMHFATSEFQLTNLGIVVTGDFSSTNFSFKKGEQEICTVHKKLLSWGDCYEVECDPELEKVILATIMVIQVVIATARNRARRR